jgi:hypothetical protein
MSLEIKFLIEAVMFLDPEIPQVTDSIHSSETQSRHPRIYCATAACDFSSPHDAAIISEPSSLFDSRVWCELEARTHKAK